MMLKIEYTTQYSKDLKSIRKRNLPESELNNVIKILSENQTLVKYRDHALKGKYNGYRECHIRPDWLLVYRKDNDRLIIYNPNRFSFGPILRISLFNFAFFLVRKRGGMKKQPQPTSEIWI
jgi:mRNA interferase YafQ